MADLALLEDLANHALHKEHIFKDRTNLFSESREFWYFSVSTAFFVMTSVRMYTFICDL